MKTVILFALAAAITDVAAMPHVIPFVTNPLARHNIQKRQGSIITGLVGGLTNPGYGKVADPAGALPRRANMQARTKIVGARTVKVRYGPYKVPNMKVKNPMGHMGALWNYPDTSIEKPCDSCVIIGMNAGLEYPDGRNANIDTGMWLHHYVQLIVGPGRTDATCGSSRVSAPHLLIGASATNSERFYSSGNERTPAMMPLWLNDTKVGYHMKPTDKFAFIVDLMNENMEDKIVYLTVTYDILDGYPAGYDDMKPIWFDVAQCGTSEVNPPQQSGKFTVKAAPWTANFDGEILGAAGHLHDGGVAVNLKVNGQTVCNSRATYGGSAEYINKMPMGHKDSATSHISAMSICANDELGIKKLQRGQVWTLEADYDYGKYKGMLGDDGHQESIMGISIMYVRTKRA